MGVDGSPSSLVATEWAADEAIRQGSPLQLVYAYPANALHEPPTAPIGRRRAEMVFETVRERLVTPRYSGLTITTRAQQGAPRRVLRHIAGNAGMLVLGRQHTGRVAELVHLSTSVPAAAKDGAVPVTVVPMEGVPPQDPPFVVLGADGSARSKAAVAHAFAMAGSLGARLVAVTGIDAPEGYSEGRHLGERWGQLVEKAATQQAEILDAFRGMYPGVQVEAVVDERSPAQALGHYAAGADRVVIGGRGHGLLTGAFLGSVARAVLRDMPCPVTVVHAHGGEHDNGKGVDDDA
ncbi:universal stress protein [Phytoactinopolyspora halophila]|uniref:universal stress protein n=1 Tax=Phytoactinopolyspora halophila TaxID=1981511 RepID=UPI0013144CDE|nr:universal stress protein [Phytoactinopolyspora halophila]